MLEEGLPRVDVRDVAKAARWTVRRGRPYGMLREDARRALKRAGWGVKQEIGERYELLVMAKNGRHEALIVRYGKVNADALNRACTS
jgi:hypothetical protein